ncbi:hypothetical protein CcaverHIS002_0603230 [Cutaneotrichosporon cavernicola]|uniref:Elongin-A n=1 Tax=Cutaneotrichosporon cavernicola TaxID=279322 RepID=A0AA48QXW8_9TREE|nr:uncharacterized protein CcaverHIS019_0602700 [Cutaneotrichosporon cavernicola]BEI86036.1 hypothetical protein CcaverHIS002_0603230 [Cutaneotrichosporon cavernicola]BEI93811.1 hypothetical protein CcaverHIS019_0602700 [Cutaneotrichosporon cavernicola]BEJ01587.1 hypothetical protein CcaverHIS631_0602690 [Cutaneotrichosporon cavernicola]BEJ09354.1 hypothetical protein CcaverHIS641_0602690 [Cutaneotrichosporon cavernicola]
MPNLLEYDEESDGNDDLFGSDDEEQGDDNIDDILPDTRKPLVPLNHSTSTSVFLTGHATSKPVNSSTLVTPDERYQELVCQRARLSPPVDAGVQSLKSMVMRVILQNASRIDDIGDLTYNEMAVFIDELPRAQLTVLEENCPHLLKDTDWLWEGFLIKAYPLFYPKCREKNGQPRTSGWRRKFAEAFQEAEERKAKAAERIKQKYAEEDKARQDKKIRVIDNFVAPPKGRRGGHTLRDARVGKQSQPTSYIAQKQVRTASVMNRARADMHRQRVALTHASGKFVPSPSRPIVSSSTSVSAGSLVHGPLITPRVPKTLPQAKSTPEANHFPGSHRTDPAARSTLPDHLKPTPTPKQERFRIDDYRMTKAPPVRDIHKPQVQNFNPDKADNGKAKVDFFTRPQPAGQPKRPLPGNEAAMPNGKRTRTDTLGEALTLASPPSGPSSRPPPPHRNSPAPGDTPSFLLKKKTNRHNGPQRAVTTTLEAVKRSAAKPVNRVPRRR